MKQFELEFSNDPSFNTVINLTNRTFNPNDITEGRMATEDQILQLEQRYNEVQETVNYCCRDIVVWKTFTRILDSGGNVISPYRENVVVGITRRGMSFTVTFSPNFDSNKYKTAEDGIKPMSLPAGYFTIHYTGANVGQQSRRWTEEVLYKDSTTLTESILPCEFPDDPAYTESNCYTPSTSQQSPPYQQSLPYTNGGFVTYFNGEVLSIDVKVGNIFRGVRDMYPDDPAYTVIFFTQFMQK